MLPLSKWQTTSETKLEPAFRLWLWQELAAVALRPSAGFTHGPAGKPLRLAQSWRWSLRHCQFSCLPACNLRLRKPNERNGAGAQPLIIAPGQGQRHVPQNLGGIFFRVRLGAMGLR